MRIALVGPVKHSGVYCILNTLNSKCYIGSSGHIYNRIHTHFTCLRKNKHHNPHLQAAYNKYTEEVFRCFPVLLCNTHDLIEKEQYFIGLLQPQYNKNQTPEQAYHRTYTEEQKKWQSDDRKKKFKEGKLTPFFAKKVSVFDDKGELVGKYKTKQEARIALCGNRQSKLNTGLRYNGYRMIDGWDIEEIEPYIKPERKISDNAREVWSRTAAKLPHPAYSKKVILTKDGKSYSFDSIEKAALYLNMKSGTSITNCLKGRCKTAAGYTCTYSLNS